MFTVKLTEATTDLESYGDYLEAFRSAGKTLAENPDDVVLVVSEDENHPVIIMYKNWVYLGNAGHVPTRGSEVETWIKETRDSYIQFFDTPNAWTALDDLLDDYRLHADTGTKLNEEVNEHE